ncbi:MAG: hypothetical protein EOL95_11335 [Bacteroidia bacterium]|nr:hypothetical protein [Bacteroidia bacterium]
MILLKLKGEKVIGVYLDISPDYTPKENEVLIDAMPQVDLKNGEIAYMYWRDGKVVYEITPKIW